MKNEETSRWIALIAIVLLASGCAEISTRQLHPRASSKAPPTSSAITLESNYVCLRVAGPSYGAIPPTSVSGPPPVPGTRIVRSNAEWERLWNYLRYRSASEPPLALPEAHVAIALTIHASPRIHSHVRRIQDDGHLATVELQVEARNYPSGPNSSTMWASVEFGDDYQETLVIFYPAGPAKEIATKMLPVLAWTPMSREEAEAAPPCPLRR